MAAGPIDSLIYAHNAIRSEAGALVEALGHASSPQAAGELAPRIVFLHEFLRMHQEGEEKGLFPVLAEAFPHVPDTYLFDHEHERAATEELVALATACASGDVAALAALQHALPIFAAAVAAHSRKED
ncbi:MAG: hemerythrin domain-containing protein [Deltaproteobacteria bacterium]|nr:hemerythrin domain-containing protein [Deltaproteobacteria bacterium]